MAETRQAEAWAVEPAQWFLVFDPVAATPWINRLVWGRFKHVSAIGWIEGQRLWVWYDVSLGRTRICVRPDDDAVTQDWLDQVGKSCAVIACPAGPKRQPLLRAGFWCVPAIKHLIGFKSGALRPDTLLRHLLRAGMKPAGGIDGASLLRNGTVWPGGARRVDQPAN